MLRREKSEWSLKRKRKATWWRCELQIIWMWCGMAMIVFFIITTSYRLELFGGNLPSLVFIYLRERSNGNTCVNVRRCAFTSGRCRAAVNANDIIFTMCFMLHENERKNKRPGKKKRNPHPNTQESCQNDVAHREMMMHCMSPLASSRRNNAHFDMN